MSINPFSRSIREYAAKQAVGAVIHAVARHTERRINKRLSSPQPPKYLGSTQLKGHNMAFEKENSRKSNTQRQQREDTPVEFWLNTVISIDDEGTLVRVNGKPLTSNYKPKSVTTNSEELNRDNAVKNMVMKRLLDEAASLEMGSEYTMIPAEYNGKLPKGHTAIQIYRTEADAAADAAATEDAHAGAEALLKDIF